MWKLNLKMNKEKWLMLLVCGIILLLLSFPAGSGWGGTGPSTIKKQSEEGFPRDGSSESGSGLKGAAAQDEERLYEKQMEQRVTELLKNVEGVGKVEVMITLKASKEKVLRVDKDKSRSSTEEKDSTGGTRSAMTEDIKESTLVNGNGTSGEPVIEKEIQPEIEGIIISAQGGGSSIIKAEISEAMEALFNVPAHKIKVLKRVE